MKFAFNNFSKLNRIVKIGKLPCTIDCKGSNPMKNCKNSKKG